MTPLTSTLRHPIIISSAKAVNSVHFYFHFSFTSYFFSNPTSFKKKKTLGLAFAAFQKHHSHTFQKLAATSLFSRNLQHLDTNQKHKRAAKNRILVVLKKHSNQSISKFSFSQNSSPTYKAVSGAMEKLTGQCSDSAVYATANPTREPKPQNSTDKPIIKKTEALLKKVSDHSKSSLISGPITAPRCDSDDRSVTRQKIKRQTHKNKPTTNHQKSPPRLNLHFLFRPFSTTRSLITRASCRRLTIPQLS